MKTRDSSIELLRVIAMFLIVISHYVSHGGWIEGVDNLNSIAMMIQNGVTLNVVFNQLVFPGGQ